MAGQNGLRASAECGQTIPELRRRRRTSKQRLATVVSALVAPDLSGCRLESELHPFVRCLSASGELGQVSVGHQTITEARPPKSRSRVRVTPRVEGGSLMPHIRSNMGQPHRHPQFLTRQSASSVATLLIVSKL